jgi:hypothetical protein
VVFDNHEAVACRSRSRQKSVGFNAFHSEYRSTNRSDPAAGQLVGRGQTVLHSHAGAYNVTWSLLLDRVTLAPPIGTTSSGE